MNILVTGGAGFIGSNIVDELINIGHKVIIIDNLNTGSKEFINSKATFYKMNLADKEIGKVFEKEDITHVIHQAAQIDVQKSINNPIFDCDINIKSTINLLEHCRNYGVEKIIYASSAAVYGKPDYLPVDENHPVEAMSPYGISKHTPEHYIKMYQQLYDIDYTILRYANVYGPRQDPKGEGGVISIFVDRMLDKKPPIIFGDGEQTRDFIYIGDIVKANIKALTNGDNELVNISCNTDNSINELYKIINEILATNIKPVYKKRKEGDIRYSYLDNTKAKKVLDWTPDYNLKVGLIETIGYYSDQKEQTEVAVSSEEVM